LSAQNSPGGGPESALDNREEIFRLFRGKRPVVFLDYDGTLTPIVERPEDAKLSDEVRQTIRKLARHCTVAVISGRDLLDVQRLVDLQDIYYAGSHGFDIAGPAGKRLVHQLGEEFLPVLDKAEKDLKGRLADNIPGAQIERKKFSIAVHYRRVAENLVGEVEDAVNQVLAEHGELRKATGKKIFELQPDIDWHKGKALLWLLEKLELDKPGVLPVYVGDDVTDEDAFGVLEAKGLGLVVQEREAPTRARYRLRNPAEVEQFLQDLIPICKESADG
jgi:trehalose 6-phosphate phosphatase